MLGQKKSRFADSSLPIDINNGINNNNNNDNNEDNNGLNASNNQLSATEVERMMADVHKQIEERKRRLNVNLILIKLNLN